MSQDKLSVSFLRSFPPPFSTPLNYTLFVQILWSKFSTANKHNLNAANREASRPETSTTGILPKFSATNQAIAFWKCARRRFLSDAKFAKFFRLQLTRSYSSSFTHSPFSHRVSYTVHLLQKGPALLHYFAYLALPCQRASSIRPTAYASLGYVGLRPRSGYAPFDMGDLRVLATA
jgi:hypothetical protein